MSGEPIRRGMMAPRRVTVWHQEGKPILRPHLSRPLLRDAQTAAAIALFTMATSATVRDHASQQLSQSYRPLAIPGYLLIGAIGVALAWRRIAPNTVLVLVFALVAGYNLIGYPSGPIYVPLVGAFLFCYVRGDRRVAYASLVAGYLLATKPLLGHTGLAVQLGLAAWLLVLAALGEIFRIRIRVRRAEAQEAELATEAARELTRRRAGEERLRIAQDLHDVLAHHLALITVQANAGLVTLTRDTDRTEAALRAIKDSGNAALGELRSVLDLLRADQDDTAPRDPTPALSADGGLDHLVDGATAAGLRVRTELLGQVRPLPGPVDRAAYRIAQEALTNAVRHSGPGTTVLIRIRYAENELHLFIDNDGHGARTDPRPDTARLESPGGGNGLPGMRERASALGGTLRAEATTRGGFLVEAALPTTGEPDPGRP